MKSDELEGIVQFLGLVAESDLAMLYRRTVALVLSTLLASTHLPPLEAVVARYPAAVSWIYGMPEQLSDAAPYFDPLSVDDIVGVLRCPWADEAPRSQRRTRGQTRSTAWGALQLNQRFADVTETLLGESPDSRLCWASR